MCASATDADRWDQWYSAPDLVWGAEPNRRLVDEVGALSPGRALDLGGGEGRNAAWLASRGWDVTIVDFARVGLDRAGEMARQQGTALTAVHADLADYAPPEGVFDLVLIMYLQVPEQTLAAVRRVHWPPVGRFSSSATTGTTWRTGSAARRTRQSCSPPSRWWMSSARACRSSRPPALNAC